MACAQSTASSIAKCTFKSSFKGSALKSNKVAGTPVAKVSQAKLVPTRDVVLRTQASADSAGTSRRELVGGAAALSALLASSSAPLPALAGGVPKGFQVYQDTLKGYKFLYPLGWQEVSVEGTDIVFKDVIEPLESVSVTIIPTQTESVKDIGTPQQVAVTLIEKVLTTPTQVPQLLSSSEREFEGKVYYTFEFTSRAANYTRHNMCTVSISNGKFFTVTAGANERRWPKLQKKVETTVKSFTLLF